MSKRQGTGSKGIACPKCGEIKSRVSCKENKINQGFVKRYRVCLNGHSFRTVETLVTDGRQDVQVQLQLKLKPA